MKTWIRWVVACLVLAASSSTGAEISFSRQVQPIFAEHCVTCHGPDNAKAGLRLDDEASAKSTRKGVTAIVPGSPKESALLHRLVNPDPDEVMPPPKAGTHVSPAQIATLRSWIEQGAKWGRHWAFEKPIAPAVPEVLKLKIQGATFTTRNPVDAFVLARCRSAGLKPSPEAGPHVLIRRLSLDLLGLPPSPQEVENFVRDSAEPGGYERLVDRLLASPHFGERWGRHWLDLARYADSDGYEKDTPRPHAWLYRDWVLDAVNRDLPFDQFTIEQLAGDLLTGATEAQRVATGFHRQTLINKEGGVDQEEFRCKATVDRTHTTGAVWLGLTLGCAECHNHKFDPVSQREFFQFYAFFNGASDRELPMPTASEIAAHQAATNRWKSRFDALTQSLTALAPGAVKALEENTPFDTTQDTGEVAKLKAEWNALRKAKPVFHPTAALVLGAEPRETFIHVRGDFLQKGERVEPGVPAALGPFQTRSAVPDRLDLARWLVSTDQPLTARVTVNHVWRQLFGRGLVASENDFGARGERPSHPELLDWLSVKFSSPSGSLTATAGEGLGWSRKALIRLIVTSTTYRQSSAWREDLATRDPINRYLARQTRHRVEAEVVRDIALAASGRLNTRVGGPSFKPALPAALAKLSYANGLAWEAASGDEGLRRGLYIHFQRTVPFPMLAAFDAPESNVTCTRRERSNSPLQALTLLNNEVFLACAESLGRRIAAHSSEAIPRLRYGFQLVTGRNPEAAELRRLARFWDGMRKRFPMEDDAACTALGRVLLNLDETITRE